MVSFIIYIYIITYFLKFVNKNLCEFFHKLIPGFFDLTPGSTFSVKSFHGTGPFEGRAVDGVAKATPDPRYRGPRLPAASFWENLTTVPGVPF